MKTKFFVLFTGCVATFLSSFGQVRFVPEDPYNNYSVGINVGYTTMYGDLSQSGHNDAFMINIAKHVTPTVTVGLELQHGTLSSTEPPQKWTTGLAMTNQFNALNINGKISMAELVKAPQNILQKAVSDLYAGIGVGVIANDITKITDKFKTTDPATINNDFKTSSLAFVVPFNLGLNIYMKRFLGYRGAQFNINYQFNYSTSDYIDGYKFSSATSHNQSTDAYSILSVGLAFYIGHVDDYQ